MLLIVNGVSSVVDTGVNSFVFSIHAENETNSSLIDLKKFTNLFWALENFTKLLKLCSFIGVNSWFSLVLTDNLNLRFECKNLSL